MMSVICFKIRQWREIACEDIYETRLTMSWKLLKLGNKGVKIYYTTMSSCLLEIFHNKS